MPGEPGEYGGAPPESRRKDSREARRARLPGMGVPGSGLPACERKGKDDGGERTAEGGEGVWVGVSNGLGAAAAAELDRRRWWFRVRTAFALALAAAEPAVLARTRRTPG